MVLCSALQTFLPHHVPLELPPTQQMAPQPIIPSLGLRPGLQPGPTARRSHPGKRLGRGPGAPGQPPRAHGRHSSPQTLFLPLETALLPAQDIHFIQSGEIGKMCSWQQWKHQQRPTHAEIDSIWFSIEAKTNCYNLRVSTLHTFIILQVRSPVGSSGFFALSLSRPKSKCSQN